METNPASKPPRAQDRAIPGTTPESPDAHSDLWRRISVARSSGFDLKLKDHEAAVLLGMAPQTMRRWRSEAMAGGPLRGPRWTRIGQSIRYSLAEVDRFLAAAQARADREAGQVCG